jgi:hypothetical protein
MFDVWRKAWARDKESDLDDAPLIQHNPASGGDLLVLGIPETSEDGTDAQAAPIVLDDVQNAAYPEGISSSASRAGLAHGVELQYTNKPLRCRPASVPATSEDRHHDHDPPPPAKRRKVAPYSPSSAEAPIKDEARLKFEAAIGANSAAFLTNWLVMTD